MSFCGVSRSDKTPFRFLFCQVDIWMMLWLLSLFTEASSEVVAPLEQGFFFDWTPSGARLPTPITAQCESIKIHWGRGNASGSNPIAPFSLSIYLSTATVPLVVPAPGDPTFELDFRVPFEPSTQYQICMYDTNGVTGGCQDSYTVYPSPNSSVCPSINMPQGYLGVEASTADGPLSRYGWVNQCSDISFKPINGTPPYTLTIAPSLRPPFNVTLQEAETFNWTVSLGYGTQFFVSMVDSKGLGWSNGPLHSGNYGSTDCLSGIGSGSSHAKSIPPAVAVGSGIGGLALGSVLGLLISFFVARWKHGKESPPQREIPERQRSGTSTTPMLTDAERGQARQQDASGRLQNRIFGGGENYRVTPYPMDAGSTRSRRSTVDDASIYETLNANASRLSFARAQSPIASVISIGRPQSPLSMHSMHARSLSEPAGSPILAATAVPSPPYSRNSTPVPGDLSSFELGQVQSLLLLHHDGGQVMFQNGNTNVYESPPGYGEVQAQDRARSPPPQETRRSTQHKRHRTALV